MMKGQSEDPLFLSLREQARSSIQQHGLMFGSSYLNHFDMSFQLGS